MTTISRVEGYNVRKLDNNKYSIAGNNGNMGARLTDKVGNDQFIKDQSKKDNVKPNNTNRNILIGIGTAITLVTLGIWGHNKASLKKAQQFFAKNLKETAGNNILTEKPTIIKNSVQELIANNSKAFDLASKNANSSIITTTTDEVAKSGIIYHGASVKNAKSILNNGATPYAASSSGQGIGKGFYTTPVKEAAQHYSNNGVVIPFDITDLRIAKLPEGKEKDVLMEAYVFLDECGVNGKQAREYAPEVIKNIFEKLGYNAAYTNKAVTEGLLTGVIGNNPDILQKAGQLAIFDGSKIKVNKELLEQINPINKTNYYKFSD